MTSTDTLRDAFVRMFARLKHLELKVQALEDQLHGSQRTESTTDPEA